MATPTTMTDLSVTAASNSPAGTESPTAGDDFLRAIQAIIRRTNAKGSDVASATTTDIGAATAEFVDVTGTTTITGLGTIDAGIVRTVRFTGALILTYNATSLILPSSANITTAAGDMAIFRSLGSGNWACVSYIRRNGAPLAFVDGSITLAKTTGIAGSGANTNITSLTGTTTNDSAAAGKIGEYIESSILVGSAVSLTTGNTANITSISLTAGDWDVSAIGRIHSNSATTSFTQGFASISQTSATLDATAQSNIFSAAAVPTNGINYCALCVATTRISLASTTTIYLVARATFTVSTAQAYGIISARRVR